MENHRFIVDLSMKHGDLSIAMSVITRVVWKTFVSSLASPKPRVSGLFFASFFQEEFKELQATSGKVRFKWP